MSQRFGQSSFSLHAPVLLLYSSGCHSGWNGFADQEICPHEQEKFPTLKKFLDKASSTDRYTTHEVKIDFEYKSVQVKSKMVPLEQRINKGFHQTVHMEARTSKCGDWIFTHNVAKEDHIPDLFYFNVIPFSEDIREFQFPSFDDLPSSVLPNDQQQEAANAFVKKLDLAASDKEEVLCPEFTPNPVLKVLVSMIVVLCNIWHNVWTLNLATWRPDAAVPPLDKTLRRITAPDRELFMQKRPGDGDSTPIQDVEEMISRRDNPDRVNKAIKGMSNKIFDPVENSYEGHNFPKALELGCVVEQEPKQFNDFLHSHCRDSLGRAYLEYSTWCC
ncbi:hypothetical protein MLD38_019191 [Melastoma candidum]|uniref:Uncharacterized protein n=1 Tax=Melastoma candidum TaxID=119954 RepID=A0ACB9QWT6_9MYRT|nr:hypothetical protein MLD38_019191 [Melastoma candidum]